ncbi:GCN5-like N-acetyltransferase [Mycobacterium tuberculosis]|nr:GCN5-like N-acetyltransferase [Mycobacterium tuberculosis]
MRCTRVRPGSGITTSGTPGTRSRANMTRSATRSTTSGRRTCAASPTLTQLTPHVARGNQECSVTAGALIARRSPFPRRRNRRSRRRYRVSAWSLSSSRQKSPTPKSGSCAGSPQARAPSLSNRASAGTAGRGGGRMSSRDLRPRAPAGRGNLALRRCCQPLRGEGGAISGHLRRVGVAGDQAGPRTGPGTRSRKNASQRRPSSGR